MKSLKKIFAGMFVAAAAFGFFGCSDTEEDENLVVEFTVSGSDSDSSRSVTLKAPEEYADKDIKIVYTLDGSQPEISFNKTAFATAADKTNIAEFVDYGTASLYESDVTISTTTTINARAFYVDAANEKCVMGSDWSSKKVTVTEDTSPSATASNTPPTSAVTFKMASTGNSNTVKYFDTANSAVFKYGDKNAYYQIQFSWKGTSKGNWYLYMREVGGGVIANGSNKFIAKGTYTGSAFDKNSATEIQTGDSHKLTLINEGGTTETEIVIAEDKSFSLKVGGVESAAISSTGAFVGDAK